MVNRVKINGQFETVARFSAHYNEGWNQCLEGLGALQLGHLMYNPGEFPGLTGVYPRDSDVHSRFIHYWTSDEEITHHRVLHAGRESIQATSSAVLQLVTAEFEPQTPNWLQEKHTAERQVYGQMPTELPSRQRVGVA